MTRDGGNAGLARWFRYRYSAGSRGKTREPFGGVAQLVRAQDS